MYTVENDIVLFLLAAASALFCFLSLQAMLKAFRQPNFTVKVQTVLMVLYSAYSCFIYLSSFFFKSSPWFTKIYFTATIYLLSVLCWWYVGYIWLLCYLIAEEEWDVIKLWKICHVMVVLMTLAVFVVGDWYLSPQFMLTFYHWQIFFEPLICLWTLREVHDLYACTPYLDA